jgi:Transposase
MWDPPRAATSIPGPRALEGIGHWMDLHARSICGATASPFTPPADVRYTQRGNRLYVHIFSWPLEHLHLPDLAGKVEYAQLLNPSEIGFRVIDTHRDTHTFELTAPSGATIATRMIGNDESGYAEAIAWMAERAPGPRVVVGLEGTRSHGIGLARVLQAAGLTVVEIERPRRGERPRGKPDPIDAHLAALHEASPERLRNHLRRPDADEDQLIMKPPLTRLIGQTQTTSTMVRWWGWWGWWGTQCGHSRR